jgi:5-methyltetrahydrofolate--homocysteine methyltransferase
MKMSMEILEPELIKAGVKPRGKLIIGTVQGDLHDIGKNLVAMMLKGAGFEVVDIGVDVGPEKFVEHAKAAGAQLVGMSALLTTTMPSMEKTLSRQDWRRWLFARCRFSSRFSKKPCCMKLNA